MSEQQSGNEAMAAAWDGPEGDHWADHADRYEATSERYGQLLLEAAALREDGAVLDIGCGTGATTVGAGRIAARGSVLGVDLSSRMLAVGRAAAAVDQLDHVRFEQADAQVHPFEPATYDVAISSFGAMFFADPVAAFTNIGGALRPGASLALTAWRELARNEWVDALRSALAAGRDLPTPPPGVPSPFSLADQAIATERFQAAGYGDIDFTALAEPMCFGKDADDAYSFISTLGITRGLTADLDDASKTAALELLHQTLADHETADGVVFASSAWLITATNRGEAG